MDIFNAMKNTQTVETENGATMFASSGKSIVDLNFKVPQMRANAIRGNNSVNYGFFMDAYDESPEYALRWLLFSRDIRGGLGEREIFRGLIVEIAKHDLELAMKIVKDIPIEEYGRFDDMIAIYPKVNSAIQAIIVENIYNQLREDIALMKEGKSISLLAKWMPSINTSSKETRAIANMLCKELQLKPRQYRKLLAKLRKYLNVVEVNLSRKSYDKIDYSAVPSKANIIYRDAFMRHDEERRQKYLDDLSNGKEKINANAMFLYDIVHNYMNNSLWGYKNVKKEDATLEELWKAQDKIPMVADTLVVRDGSGSMTVQLEKTSATALDVANSICLYCAENNTKAFKNKFITFSSSPELVTLHGNTLHDRLVETSQFDDCSNTDLEKTFDLVLKAAIKNHLTQEELPANILIISDMEFDYAHGRYDYWSGKKSMDDEVLMETISKKFTDAGYKLPRLVFWNVNSRTSGIPLQQNENGVVLVSGFSKNILDMVISGELDPWKALKKVLDNSRYDVVKQVL
jgi:hypothetical protein